MYNFLAVCVKFFALLFFWFVLTANCWQAVSINMLTRTTTDPQSWQTDRLTRVNLNNLLKPLMSATFQPMRLVSTVTPIPCAIKQVPRGRGAATLFVVKRIKKLLKPNTNCTTVEVAVAAGTLQSVAIRNQIAAATGKIGGHGHFFSRLLHPENRQSVRAY